MAASKPLLRYKADVRTIVFVALSFVFSYGGFFLFPYASWAVLIPLFILSCLFCFFCAIIVHNTLHSPMFHSKGWNKAFQYVLSLAYGYSVSAFVPGHNFSHHKETQGAKDTMRSTKARFRWNFLNQFLFPFIVTPQVMLAEQRFVKKMKKSKPDWYRQWLAETILVNIVKIGVLIINWKAALFFIWIPHLYGTWGLVGTNVWQHDGTDQDHPHNHSRSFTSPILNFFAFNNGYHGAHHDRPALHWSLLPEYHEKHVAPHLHPNLNRVSLVGYLWEAYVYPGKRVDYLGNPIGIPEKVKEEDWVADIRIGERSHAEDLGAAGSSEEDLEWLETMEVTEGAEEKTFAKS